MKDPLVFILKVCLFITHREPFAGLILEVHYGKPRSIPELVGEITGSLYPLRDVSRIVARGDSGAEHESQSVSSVLVYGFERIDSVAERLGHLASELVPYQAVNEYVVIRRVSHALISREHHPYYPEEYDVISCHEDTVRIEVVERFCLFRPSEC